MDDEAARILNAKIEDHKAFFIKLPEVLTEFTAALNSPIVNQVPSEQLQSMATRLSAIGSLATRRAVKLKFLEHKVLVFIYLKNLSLFLILTFNFTVLPCGVYRPR
jgi:hypothetical protein